MSSNEATAKDFSELDAQEAQAALAEALDAEVVEAEAEEAEEQQEAEAQLLEGEVLSLAQEEDEEAIKELFGTDENPFAAAAEFARQVRMVEALLFAANEPLDAKTMRERLPEGAKIKDLLSTLQQQYENRGVNLKKTGKKWQFVTAPDVSHILEKEQVQPRKLSRAALETLAIIAYHQPCTRAEIEEVRGVAVSKGSLDQLLEIGWLKLKGRREDTPGRPLLYGTSETFLEHFGLESISHLPGLADLKAAGLLDARLPPGFSVPTPKDETAIEGAEDGPAEQDFVQDFHDEEAIEAEGEGVEMSEEPEEELAMDETIEEMELEAIAEAVEAEEE